MLSILVDLDGTIINSGPGIIGSYQHALRCMGVECPPAEDLTWVVGPPSRRSFPKLIRPDQDVEQAVRLYREHYEHGCAIEDERPGDAIEAYRRALDHDPFFADAHVNLGRLLHEQGDPFTALQHYRSALTARPDDATAAFNLGVALEDLDRVREAIDAYERAIDLDPDNADAHYNLARLFEQSGKPDAAIRHLLVYRKLTKGR